MYYRVNHPINNGIPLIPERCLATIRDLYNKKLCIRLILAVLVGTATIGLIAQNIPDKEPVNEFHDLSRPDVDSSISDAHATPQPMVEDNTSIGAHQPYSLGNSEKRIVDDQGNKALAPSACSGGVCANVADVPNQNIKKNPISKIAGMVSLGGYGTGKSGVESFWNARFGGRYGVTNFDENPEQLATLDRWQANFAGVTDRISAAFPNAIVVREAASFADELAQNHHLTLILLILLTLILSDIAESTAESLDELVSKLLRRMFNKK